MLFYYRVLLFPVNNVVQIEMLGTRNQHTDIYEWARCTRHSMPAAWHCTMYMCNLYVQKMKYEWPNISRIASHSVPLQIESRTREIGELKRAGAQAEWPKGPRVGTSRADMSRGM